MAIQVLVTCTGGGSVTLDAAFPGANIVLVNRVGKGHFDIALRPDPDTTTFHWFAFRVRHATGQLLTFRIVNAGLSFASPSWSFSRPSVSDDGGRSWRRLLHAKYKNGIFSFSLVPRSADELVAYAPVYTTDRWHSLILSLRGGLAAITIDTVAFSDEGRAVEVLSISQPPLSAPSRAAVWLIARQHPAEVGGSWLLEGLLRWYVGPDPLALRARAVSVLYAVGIANPDGVERGYYRTDALGRDIADHWMRPMDQASPMVIGIKNAIRESAKLNGRVGLVIDLHSHSTYRKNFAFLPWTGDSGANTSHTVDRLAASLATATADFSLRGSYRTALTLSGFVGAWATHEVGAPGLVIETTYHDLADVGRPHIAMTPSRLGALGQALGKQIAKQVLSDIDLGATRIAP